MPKPAAPPALYRFYRHLTGALLPLAWRGVEKKLRAHDVPEARARERLGHATLPRADGPLVWFHAASVGESLAVLSLIARMGERLPRHEFLITSGTATSAELIARRMPPRARHQFAPLDAPGPVARFLNHWRPEAAIFAESELWPLVLTETRARGARLALVNARLSEGSVKGWSRFPKTARFVLDRFSLFLAQNRTAFDHLRQMGADPARIEIAGNLKASSAPLPVDADLLARLRGALGDRPAWIASSTHPGEEAIVLAAHERLLRRQGDLCLILIPRHPDRRAEIGALIAERGFDAASRGAGTWPGPDTQVYLADSLGETGTWYEAAPIVFLGGSLFEIGGHNPFEPAQAGAAILTGPHVVNFAESFEPLFALGAARRVSDAGDLAAAVADWLSHPDRLAHARGAARRFMDEREDALDRLAERLCEALDLR